MPQIQSLDDLIAKKAIEYADQIKAAAAMADKEEEIRIESEKQLAFIQKEAGIKLEGKHEFTVASGRIDSVYSRVIIEYKNPKSPGDRIGPRADSPGSKKVVEQIKKRFYDMRHEHGQPLNSLFGVGVDGNHFIFVRFRDEKWDIQEPVEVNRHSAERFLWALFNLGKKGKPFSPEYLAGDFGSEGGNTVAIKGIHALYDAILTTDNPKAQTFFSQWKILFGEVCGYDVDSPSDKIKKLAEFYQVIVKDPKPAELLFAVHTYYALFMKLMAAQIVAFFHKLPTPLEKMMQATTSNKLKREMEDLEAGSIFRHLNITNFLEGDLFAWYTSVWTEPIEKLVREMVTRLDDYNPGTLSEDPTGSRDLLKKLYQQLFPKSVRHDLGEYYTPDWLAEHVLNELGYVGDPDKRLLDPACGSGTFLVMAINRIRRWYEENREHCQFDESELGRKIIANIIGFDLNPLAVMAARTNYLIAIRDLIGHMDRVEIPVYLCDSIMTPSEYGGLFAGGLGKARQLKTAPATFLIPTEIATNSDDVAKYAEQLETAVRRGYSAEEFIQRCRDERLPIGDNLLHTELYLELVKLEKANKNGIWARIIKNAFAPLFIRQVDYIAGNPPWVRWGYLPADYRESTSPLWRQYGLFSLKGFEARLGSGEKDLSQLFTYVCIDRYLKENGKIGFLITQTVFKAKGQAEGFRRFRIGEVGPHFRVTRVDDLSRVQAFEAANLTAIMIAEKGNKTSYPVPYFLWLPRQTKSLYDLPSLEQVKEQVYIISQKAKPSGSAQNSQWQTGTGSATSAFDKICGRSDYTATRGAGTDPYGIYHIHILKQLDSKYVLAQNIHDAGKKSIEQLSPFKIEHDLLFPLVRGRDIERWAVSPVIYVLITQDPVTRLAIPLIRMRQNYQQTLDYLRHFETDLRQTSSKFARSLKERSEFYAMYGIGTELFAQWRVAWRRMGNIFKASVILPKRDDFLGVKALIPSDTVSFIACESRQESMYLCALLNSSPCRASVYSFSAAGRGLGSPAIIKNLRLTKFKNNESLHQELVQKAEQLTLLAHNHESSPNDMMRLENELDALATQYWSLTSRDLAALFENLRQIETRRTVAKHRKLEEMSPGEIASVISDLL